MKHVGEERAWYSPPYELEGENCWVQSICGLGQLGLLSPNQQIKEIKKRREKVRKVDQIAACVRRRAVRKEEREIERESKVSEFSA